MSFLFWSVALRIYGNCIVIDHGNGLQSIYGHLSEFNVKKGDAVKRGQQIGMTGSTGAGGRRSSAFQQMACR